MLTDIKTPCLIGLLTKLPSNVIIDMFDQKMHSQSSRSCLKTKVKFTGPINKN